MPYGFYISAEGAHAQSKRLEVIANNLANADTAGFKRQLAVFTARDAEATRRGEDTAGSRSLNDLGGGVLVRETKTDFSRGPLKPTGVNTDLALRGDGFFTVRHGEETFLTRAGNFHFTAKGELITEYGGRQYAVLNESMSPVTINPQDNTWEFTPSGGLRQAGGVQNLAIVRPESVAQLERVGENLFRADGETLPLAPGERDVACGYLELSAVQPATELIDMIEASRAIEANISLMQAQDQMLSGLFSRVLRT